MTWFTGQGHTTWFTGQGHMTWFTGQTITDSGWKHCSQTAQTQVCHAAKHPQFVRFLSHSQGPAAVSIKLRTVALIPFHLGDQHGQHTRNAYRGVCFPIDVGLKRQ